jgi:NAD(P)-dependent dehydrogenase (short-subunit alcohol dehydrogenase family)
MRLKNKIALVTGAGMGMGREAALGLAREGAAVTVADINSSAGERTAQDIIAAGGRALYVRADVTQARECEAMVATAEHAFGPLNTAYVNAAVQLHGQDTRAHELPENIWDKTHAINLKGMWLSSKYILASMLRAGGGSLILAGSPTGLQGAANYTAYATSKAGTYALARTIAQDYARDKIRCNVLVPGPMNTPLTQSLFADPEFNREISAATMLGRIGEAHEIVGLLVFLASDEASYCTGGYYMADGGMVT